MSLNDEIEIPSADDMSANAKKRRIDIINGYVSILLPNIVTSIKDAVNKGNMSCVINTSHDIPNVYYMDLENMLSSKMNENNNENSKYKYKIKLYNNEYLEIHLHIVYSYA